MWDGVVIEKLWTKKDFDIALIVEDLWELSFREFGTSEEVVRLLTTMELKKWVSKYAVADMPEREAIIEATSEKWTSTMEQLINKVSEAVLNYEGR